MKVDENSATSRDIDGKTYYFSIRKCANTFSGTRVPDSVPIQPSEHDEMLNKECYNCYVSFEDIGFGGLIH